MITQGRGNAKEQFRRDPKTNCQSIKRFLRVQLNLITAKQYLLTFVGQKRLVTCVFSS